MRRALDRWAPHWSAFVAAAAMLGMGLWGLGRSSAMSNDETATRWASSLPLSRLGHLLAHIDAVHGFYYLLMHVWMRVVGGTPTTLRVPSVLAMTAAAALVAVLARRLTGSATSGLLAGLIMAFTPAISFYAQTARSYALVYLGAVGLTLLLVHGLETAGAAASRYWIGYGALVVVTGYLNEMALLLVPAHAVTLALVRTDRDTWRRWLTAAVAGCLCVVPLVYVSDRESGVLDVLQRPGFAAVRDTFRSYFTPRLAIEVPLAACAVVAIVTTWGRSRELTLAKVAAPILLVPVTALFAYSHVAKPLFTDRYILYGELGAALLAGAGADRLLRAALHGSSPRLRVARVGVAMAAAACVLLTQLPTQSWLRTPGSRRFDLGSAAAYVDAHARPGDGVLFLTGFYRKVKLGYPQDFRHLDDFALGTPPAVAGNFRGGLKPFPVVRPEMLQHERVWVVGNPPHQRLPAGAPARIAWLLEQRYVVVTRARFSHVSVTLWRRVGPPAVS